MILLFLRILRRIDHRPLPLWQLGKLRRSWSPRRRRSVQKLRSWANPESCKRTNDRRWWKQLRRCMVSFLMQRRPVQTIFHKSQKKLKRMNLLLHPLMKWLAGRSRLRHLFSRPLILQGTFEWRGRSARARCLHPPRITGVWCELRQTHGCAWQLATERNPGWMDWWPQTSLSLLITFWVTGYMAYSYLLQRQNLHGRSNQIGASCWLMSSSWEEKSWSLSPNMPGPWVRPLSWWRKMRTSRRRSSPRRLLWRLLGHWSNSPSSTTKETTKETSRVHTTRALERRVKRARKVAERVRCLRLSRAYNWCGALRTIVICVLHGTLATSVMIDAVVCTNAEWKDVMATTRPLITKKLPKVLDRKNQLLGPASQQLVILFTLRWFISLLAGGGTQTWGPFCNKRLHLVVSHSASMNSILKDHQNMILQGISCETKSTTFSRKGTFWLFLPRATPFHGQGFNGFVTRGHVHCETSIGQRAFLGFLLRIKLWWRKQIHLFFGALLRVCFVISVGANIFGSIQKIWVRCIRNIRLLFGSGRRFGIFWYRRMQPHLQFNNVILGLTHLNLLDFWRRFSLMILGVILVGLSFLQTHILDHFRGHVVMYINRNSLDNKMENGERVQVRPTHLDFVNSSPSCVSLPPHWSEGVKTTHLKHRPWKRPPQLHKCCFPESAWIWPVGAFFWRLVRNLIHTQSLAQLVLQRAHPLVLQVLQKAHPLVLRQSKTDLTWLRVVTGNARCGWNGTSETGNSWTVLACVHHADGTPGTGGWTDRILQSSWQSIHTIFLKVWWWLSWGTWEQCPSSWRLESLRLHPFLWQPWTVHASGSQNWLGLRSLHCWLTTVSHSSWGCWHLGWDVTATRMFQCLLTISFLLHLEFMWGRICLYLGRHRFSLRKTNRRSLMNLSSIPLLRITAQPSCRPLNWRPNSGRKRVWGECFRVSYQFFRRNMVTGFVLHLWQLLSNLTVVSVHCMTPHILSRSTIPLSIKIEYNALDQPKLPQWFGRQLKWKRPLLWSPLTSRRPIDLSKCVERTGAFWPAVRIRAQRRFGWIPLGRSVSVAHLICLCGQVCRIFIP